MGGCGSGWWVTGRRGRSRSAGPGAWAAQHNVRFLPVQTAEWLGEMLAADDIHLVVQRREAADLDALEARQHSYRWSAERVTADPETELAGSGLGLVPWAPGDGRGRTGTVISRLAHDAGLREAAGQRARAYAERYLNCDRIPGDFEERLAELVQVRKPHGGGG